MIKLWQILHGKHCGFSLAEALITLLIVCLITLASIPILTKKKRAIRENQKHGYYACYWDANDNLQAKMVHDSIESNGSVIWDEEERRYGCVFNPPSGTKNFVATIIGGGGGGAGAAYSNSKKKTFTNPGQYTYTTEAAGVYDFLVVGGGGGGGSGDNEYNLRGGAGTPGEMIGAYSAIIDEGQTINIVVGGGGAKSSYYSGMGYPGTPSKVEIENPDLKIYARAGGGGVGYDIHPHVCGGDIRNRQGALHGYDSNGNYKEYNFGCNADQTKLIMLYGRIWEKKACNLLSSTSGISSFLCYYETLNGAMTSGETKVERGEGVNVTTATHLTEPANALGYKSQNKLKYNNILLLSLYDDQFGLKFNVPVQGEPAIEWGMAKGRCARSSMYDLNGKTWTDPLLRANVTLNGYCFDFENNFGAGGGGGGHYTSDFKDGSFVDPPASYDVYGIEGKGGFVGIKYKPVYAGLGGEAGKVMQIPYSELPLKTILFPGKGGEGGRVSYLRPPEYRDNDTGGQAGESSYIKNGTPVLGGAGATKISRGIASTYSTERSTLNKSYIAGKNGRLSDVLTSKKATEGGLGGYNTSNNSPDGLSLNGFVFKNGAAIDSFNKIYGAGAGGGGGAAFADYETAGNGSANSQKHGNGGRGTSGLVFIQW